MAAARSRACPRSVAVARKLGFYNEGIGGRMVLSDDEMPAPVRLPTDPDPDPDRATLARWLVRGWDPGRDDALDEAALDRLLDLAWSEGVRVQACARLAAVETITAQRRQDCQAWVRQQAAAALGVQGRLRAVLDSLQQARIPVLVLKGAALAHWLSPAPYLRESSDVDLLLADRDDALRAARVLASLGYALAYPPGRFTHELSCRHRDGGLGLDLHWALRNL